MKLLGISFFFFLNKKTETASKIKTEGNEQDLLAGEDQAEARGAFASRPSLLRHVGLRGPKLRYFTIRTLI